MFNTFNIANTVVVIPRKTEYTLDFIDKKKSVIILREVNFVRKLHSKLILKYVFEVRARYYDTRRKAVRLNLRTGSELY